MPLVGLAGTPQSPVQCHKSRISIQLWDGYAGYTLYTKTFVYLPGGGGMHVKLAGSGVQFLLAAQTDIICADGTNPGLH